jgi:hypothetical protein
VAQSAYCADYVAFSSFSMAGVLCVTKSILKVHEPFNLSQTLNLTLAILGADETGLASCIARAL